MAVPFFNLTRQISSQESEMISAVTDVIKSGAFILGPNVAAFEKEFAEANHCKHAIGVASGTEALHIALRACGVKAGDEVITTPFTFIASSGSIAFIGAKPVFADINPTTFNLDPHSVEKKITAKTKAIMPVHLYGLSADMDPFLSLAKKHNLKIVEDAAQATGALYNGKPVGSMGDAGAFSFFPTKNLGGFGDGGMITTNSDEIASEVKVLRNHGSRQQYFYDIMGFNSRLDEIQAVVLRKRMRHLSSWIDARRSHAAYYRKALSGVKGITLPSEPQYATHTYNQFTLLAEHRDELMAFLKTKQVGSAIYYPLALHLQKVYADLGYRAGDLPNSEKVQSQVLSLPIFPELTPTELQEVAQTIIQFYG